ncbi:hypothetical protein ACJJTC_013514 [Scirpophaga incertulas]
MVGSTAKEKVNLFASLFAENSRLDSTGKLPPSLPQTNCSIPVVHIHQKEVAVVVQLLHRGSLIVYICTAQVATSRRSAGLPREASGRGIWRKFIPLHIIEEDSYEKDVLFYVNLGEPELLGGDFLYTNTIILFAST